MKTTVPIAPMMSRATIYVESLKQRAQKDAALGFV